MPVNQKSAAHICTVIKRQFQDEYPDLTLAFILHEEGKRKKAIAANAPALQDHPAGHKILNYIDNANNRSIAGNRSVFVGIAEHENKGFLNFRRAHKTIAAFFINHDRFNTDDNLRSHIYHFLWHTLELMKDTQDNKNIARPLGPDEIIIPDLKPERLYHRNLTADIYAATLQELLGRENSIKQLAKLRMNATLSAERGFMAERFPFPISIETLEFLFSESIKTKKKEKALPQAVSITKEIGMTYGAQSLLQWKSFALPAQEMAWSGFKRETILGTAIYTSENTYMRAIADMIAEHSDVTPEIITSLNGLNPFTDQEANERLHIKSCHQTLRALLERIKTKEHYQILLTEAEKQNKALMMGQTIGWCGHALVSASIAIQKSASQDIDQIHNDATRIFEDMLKKSDWQTLRNFSKKLFLMRRDGQEISPELILSIAEKNEDLRFIKTAFKNCPLST